VGLRFQLGERSLRIDGDPQAAIAAVEAIRNSGFEIHPWPAAPASTQDGDAAAHDHDAKTGTGLPRLLAALALAIAAEGLSFFVPDAPWSRPAGLAIAAAAIALAGFGTFRKGLTALRHGRLNINALMTVAVAGAFVIGQWPEAAMVMALYAIAELIEARAVDRARNAISGLLALSPEMADLRQADGTWKSVPVGEVPIGATVRVRPGERVAMDGVVTEGGTSIDQAPVTGESLPVDKSPGDAVYAGTINQTGTIECRVTAAASQSTLARIIHAVEQAQGSRAPTQRFVDRFAAIYTPAVFVLALAVAIAGPWLFGWTVLAAVYKALVLLVIACPCALVIATPVTVVSGLASAARSGILIKGGVHLEQARLLKAIALDKTGTITEGKPRLVEWQMLTTSVPKARAEHIAAALAAHSDHPVSRAIAAGLTPNSIEARSFAALSGRGIEADIDGERYVLGNHRLIEERGQCSAEIEAVLHRHEQAGRSVSLLATASGVVALFAVADTTKPSSAAAIDELKAMGITPVMLTGDNQTTAEAIGREAGLTDIRGNLLPEDKLAAIQAMQKQYGATAMTGDGINDAPALAQADVGVAMGTGTDVAMNSAPVTLVKGDLRGIAQARLLSQATIANMKQNLGFAFIYNALGVPLAAGLLFPFTGWLLSPMIAALAMSLSSASVIGNALRLRKAALLRD
jgi:Cd2+/Zn2+-exporting ATPase